VNQVEWVDRSAAGMPGQLLSDEAWFPLVYLRDGDLLVLARGNPQPPAWPREFLLIWGLERLQMPVNMENVLVDPPTVVSLNANTVQVVLRRAGEEYRVTGREVAWICRAAPRSDEHLSNSEWFIRPDRWLRRPRLAREYMEVYDWPRASLPDRARGGPPLLTRMLGWRHRRDSRSKEDTRPETEPTQESVELGGTEEPYRRTDGRDFSLWEWTRLHNRLVFCAEHHDHEPVWISFSAVRYVDLPARMAGAKLRRVERERSSGAVPGGWIPPWVGTAASSFVIDHEQGQGVIASEHARLHLPGSPPISFVPLMPNRLWPGGPRCSDLSEPAALVSVANPSPA
jgi:hypothetical protein